MSSVIAGGPSGAAASAVRVEARVLVNAADGTAGYRLLLRVPDWPGSAPGQFLMISPGALADVRRDDPLLPRPMAVYREVRREVRREVHREDGSGEEARVEVLYKVEGRGTALLADATAGDRVLVVGPLGRPFPAPPKGGHVVIVGGGTGVASLYGLAAWAAGEARVSVILGARSSGDLLALADFEALGLDLHVTTEDGSLSEQGLVTAPLLRLLSAGDVDRVYCCGPTPMMRACAELAAARQVACSVSLENNMACGFGVCLGCAAPLSAGAYALVCRDGPVFEASEIDWAGLP